MKSKKIIYLLVGLGVIVLFITPLIISYSNLAFLPNQATFAADNLVSQIPFLPKTTRQILVRSKIVNEKLNSYKTKTLLEISGGGYKLVSVSIDGAIKDINSEKVQSTTAFKGTTLYPVPLGFDFQTASFGKDLFFKVNQGAALPNFDTTTLGKVWYQTNLDSLQKDLKISSRDDIDIIKDEKAKLEDYLAQLLKNKNLDGAKVTKVSKDGQTYHQITLKADSEPLSQLIVGDSLKNKEVEVTVLIDEKSRFLKSFLIKAKKLTQDGKAVEIKFDYILSEQNKNFSIEKPQSIQTISSASDLYLLLNKSKKPSVEEVFQALGAGAKESLADFLTVERITRVVLLLPKAL
ncbi:MAG TPA: hypothetical protein VLE47_02475 [Candidatus Saccharimonadales bacterium]|nr:hypothetical protein [Candidatus Saccharimonadales bacterium]